MCPQSPKLMPGPQVFKFLPATQGIDHLRQGKTGKDGNILLGNLELVALLERQRKTHETHRIHPCLEQGRRFKRTISIKSGRNRLYQIQQRLDVYGRIGSRLFD